MKVGQAAGTLAALAVVYGTQRGLSRGVRAVLAPEREPPHLAPPVQRRARGTATWRAVQLVSTHNVMLG